MSRRWRITIEAWPYSTGAGAEADQKACEVNGDRTIYFYVTAEDIDAAMQMARCFSQGMKINPRLWQAPIMGVHKWPEGKGEPCSPAT